MLGKLLKHEFKTTARGFFILYGGLILLALVNLVLLKFNNLFQSTDLALLNILSAIALVILVLYLISIFIITVILCIMRFYKNLLGDEGYLMNTLPVNGWSNIGSKLIVSVVWNAASIAVLILSALLIGLGASGTPFFELLRGVFTFLRQITAGEYLALFELGVLALVSLSVFYLAIYAALTIGHSFAKHKLMMSVAAYVLLYIAETVIKSVGILLLDQISYIHVSINTLSEVPHLYIWIITLSAAVFGAAYYVIANYFLTRRLNLQ